MSYADLLFDPEDAINPEELNDYYEFLADMRREDALVEEYENAKSN